MQNHEDSQHEENWHRFLNTPLSGRVRRVLENAQFTSLELLIQKSAEELLKYRNCGRSCLTELRLALAKFNLSLHGEPVFTPTDPRDTDPLKARLKALEQKRAEVQIEISQIKAEIAAQRPLRRKPSEDPELDKKLLVRWKELRDYSIVARELGVSVNKVRSVVLRRLA